MRRLIAPLAALFVLAAAGAASAQTAVERLMLKGLDECIAFRETGVSEEEVADVLGFPREADEDDSRWMTVDGTDVSLQFRSVRNGARTSRVCSIAVEPPFETSAAFTAAWKARARDLGYRQQAPWTTPGGGRLDEMSTADRGNSIALGVYGPSETRKRGLTVLAIGWIE